MLSALWLLPLVWILSASSRDPAVGPLDVLYFALTALFWLGHRLGSAWLAYGTSAYRPLLRAQPVRFLAVPAAIAIACVAILLPADDALPWSRTERVIVLAVLDYFLVTYHFAAQHYGALSLYRVRAGAAGNRELRRLDRLYALVIGGVLVFVAEIVAGSVAFIDVWLDSWLDPTWITAASGTIAGIGIAIVIASTLGMLALELRAERPSLPRALYLVGLGAMVVAAFRARAPFMFIVIWTAQHWIVASGLTLQVAEADPAPARAVWHSLLHAVNRRPWALLLALTILSVLLLPIMEVEAAPASGPYYAERIFGAFAAALRSSSWVPALVALGLATGFCHYWLDRAVYRLSDPRVRLAARGLMNAP